MPNKRKQKKARKAEQKAARTKALADLAAKEKAQENAEEKAEGAAAEEPVQEPAKETVQEPAKETVQETAQEPALESAQETAEEASKENAQETAQETVSEVVQSCVGPKSEHIKLISADDKVFLIKREAACLSSVLEGMANFPGYEDSEEEVIVNIPACGDAVEVVVKYLEQELTNLDSDSEQEVDIPDEISMDVVVLSDFLDI